MRWWPASKPNLKFKTSKKRRQKRKRIEKSRRINRKPKRKDKKMTRPDNRAIKKKTYEKALRKIEELQAYVNKVENEIFRLADRNTHLVNELQAQSEKAELESRLINSRRHNAKLIDKLEIYRFAKDCFYTRSPRLSDGDFAGCPTEGEN